MTSGAALLSSDTARPRRLRATSSRGLEWRNLACGIRNCSKRIHRRPGPGIDLYSMHQPLGVSRITRSISRPYPVVGNARRRLLRHSFILKSPSAIRRCRCASPTFIKQPAPGVLNVVNGDKEAVDTLLTDARSKHRLVARRRSPNTFMRLNRHGKRCNASAAQEPMIVSPTPTWIRRDALSPATARPASVQRSRWRCGGKENRDALVQKLIRASKSLRSVRRATPGRLRPWSARASQQSEGYIEGGVQEGPSSSSTPQLQAPGYENGNFIGAACHGSRQI